MRLTLVISSLAAGGAERAMALMANHWAREGRHVSLLTFDDGSTAPFYELDSAIKHYPLNLMRDSQHGFAAVSNNVQRIRKLRSSIRQSQPECVISFMDQVNVLTLLATRHERTPVLVVEQTYPAAHRIGRPWELMRNYLYPKAERVVALTERMLHCFSPQIQARGCVIPNPILTPGSNSETLSEKLLDPPTLLAVGRLDQPKGFDLLLNAFAQLIHHHLDWTLAVLGDGPLRQELETLKRQLNLDGRVKFYGRVSNPSDFMQQADLFVTASRYEGFPMALCEAMACGLPVISTDCPTGPREIIREGVDGILVPNEDVGALTAALDRLMSDEALRRRMGQYARTVTERFGIKKVMRMWEELLEQAINESR